jgi:hypothetical protein
LAYRRTILASNVRKRFHHHQLFLAQSKKIGDDGSFLRVSRQQAVITVQSVQNLSVACAQRERSQNFFEKIFSKYAKAFRIFCTKFSRSASYNLSVSL